MEPASGSPGKIVELREKLGDGLDAGAHTIAVRLARRRGEVAVPSAATIWPVLTRQGFVTSSPRGRHGVRSPGSKQRRRTGTGKPTAPHLRPAGETEVEVLNVIVLMAGLHVRVLTEDGELLRLLT